MDILEIEPASYEKLKKSNGILHKWAKHFGVSIHKKIDFYIDLYKNKDKYYSELPSEKKSKFTKDHKVMFYALQVENALIKQYYNTILHMIRKFKITTDKVDHFRDAGLSSIRNSIWSFTNHKSKVSFMTFCYNGLFLRFRSEGHKVNLKRHRKKYKHFISVTDIVADKKNNFFELSADQDALPAHQHLINKEHENVVAQVFAEANLDEDECFIIKSYMQRDNLNLSWNADCIEFFKSKYNRSLRKQAIHNKLFKIQRKLWVIYSKKYGLTFYDKNLLFLHNASTRNAERRSAKSLF